MAIKPNMVSAFKVKLRYFHDTDVTWAMASEITGNSAVYTTVRGDVKTKTNALHAFLSTVYPSMVLGFKVQIRSFLLSCFNGWKKHDYLWQTIFQIIFLPKKYCELMDIYINSHERSGRQTCIYSVMAQRLFGTSIIFPMYHHSHHTAHCENICYLDVFVCNRTSILTPY